MTPVQAKTGDEISAERFRLIAAKLRADPALLAIPLANIERWLARGHSAVARLTGWRTMLEAARRDPAALEKVVRILEDNDSHDAIMWKGFSPFPGVLTEEELARLSWTSSH